MDKYAVMGFPIAHSKSPQIHQLFAEQTGELLSYEKLEVPTENFNEAIEQFVQLGGRGLNITVPLKTLAYQRMDELDADAQIAKAVNTVCIDQNKKLIGYNTDGIGLSRDLIQNHKVELSGHSILILGAGGAVQGVLKNLLDSRPNLLTVANRTVEKAHHLAKIFSKFGNITASGINGITGKYDIIINGTSSSLNNTLPAIPDGCLASDGIVYDMMYCDRPTAFVQWGIKQRARLSVDGLGMLIEQAGESFYIWRGQRPDTQAVVKHLSATT